MKAIFGFLAIVILVLFVVILFARGGNDNNVQVASARSLNSAASSDAVFTFTESGPILSEEEHAKTKITISRNERRVEIFQGYKNTVVRSATFNNSEAAFYEFLSALEGQGYLNSNRTSFDSEDGLCPRGRRFKFESNQFGEDFSRWTTSCSENGDFGGNFRTARHLFRSQIPDIEPMTKSTRRELGISF